MVETEQTFLRTFCGTLLYCAPEVYTEYTEYDDNGFRNRHRVRRAPGQRYNHAVDIWSLGGVIFFTLTRSPPYPASSGISYSELLHKIMTTRLNIAPLQQYRVSDLGIDFLCRMLQRRPEHRATIAELDSHSWLGGPGSIIDASQSYDEITDDEDLMHTIKAQEWEGDDVISDSMGEDSEKENNDTFGQPNQTQRPRLFGEIGVSAVGSSGVLPEDFLPLPAVNGSGQETVIQNFEGEDAYNSGASSVFAEAQALSQIDGNAYVSALQNQSADQLQSLVLDVASQSLGGRSAEDGNVSMTKSLDFTASKRKPPSNSTSDEFDDGLSTKPTFKRLRSEANLEDLTSHLVEEYKLLACMPQINVLDSGRQIDNPVDKRSYWEQDRATWHLDYPEMTQLQHDAFSQAARDRGEEFWPAKTPLWELSMKYFPPTQDNRTVVDTDPPRIGLKRDDRKMGDETIDFPPTARPTDEEEDIPDTLPPDQRIVVPIQEDPSRSRAVGLLQSDVDSHIDDISLTITEPFMSFGRGPENTDMYKRRTESKVPKYAFKMLLIKDDYDPNKDSPKASYPWLTESEDPEAYHFWISTKATLGIKVNGHTIPSYDPKNPSGPSRHWARVHDGDELLIWGDVKNHTSLKFRCFWGASSKAREDVRLPPVMATEDWFQILDGTCLRAEKRYRESAERRRRVNEAVADLEERIRLVDRERQRSRAFEMKRVEAVKFLQARQIHVPRRGSTASAPPAAAYSSRLQSTTAGTTQASRLTPD
jgi:serine/threonine protein kinase